MDMLPPTSVEQMLADNDWQLWANQGWSLYQKSDGQVLAFNLGERLATVAAKRFDTILKRLEKGQFDYKSFVSFRKYRDLYKSAKDCIISIGIFCVLLIGIFILHDC